MDVPARGRSTQGHPQGRQGVAGCVGAQGQYADTTDTVAGEKGLLERDCDRPAIYLPVPRARST